MENLAIDIVLLLPSETNTEIIDLNRQLGSEGTEQIILDEENCMPHISLRMGVVNKSKLGQLIALLAKLDIPKQLKINGLEERLNLMGMKTSYLHIEKSAELESLHIKIMNIEMSLFETTILPENFHQSERINTKTLAYVEDFSHYANEN